MKCFMWLILASFTLTSGSLIVQLLLLPLFCFLSGSRWVPSYNNLFFIPSLAVLCWILCFA
uniref:Uncharacterized protein n=1 Tax=Aotus nancymaae TaxID=37293 RepID=A0A2K5CR58_AOTNA